MFIMRIMIIIIICEQIRTEIKQIIGFHLHTKLPNGQKTQITYR